MLSIMLQRLGLIEPDPVAEHPARTTAAMLLLSLFGACLTGVLAQMRLPLPGTPVPLTGQVLAVLVCGALLGSGYGALSQIIYVAFGVAGAPWFAGGAHGFAVLAGPTGGYLLGFVVAALFLGTVSERTNAAKTLGAQLTLMLVAVSIIWFFGLIHIVVTLQVSLTTAFIWGVVPFIAADVIKAVLAALFTSAVLPKSA